MLLMMMMINSIKKLKFENYYFEGIKPSAPENEILNELVKLDAYFITSNYDFEIERHFWIG